MLNPFLKVDPYLRDAGVENELRRIIVSVAHAGKYVAHAIRNETPGFADSSNFSGENQLALDVLSDKIFCEHVQASGMVVRFASEEQRGSVEISSHAKGKFSVAFDPLDGSSLVDADLAIGSIFAIYRGEDFIGKTGRDIVSSGYILYGPKTLFVVATKQGIWEFTENAIGEFVLTRENMVLAPVAKYFAPGNLRAINSRTEYEQLVLSWGKRQLVLRYSGGMVPDIHMIVSKGSGIFAYPGGEKYPQGKLRLLFECAPFAFLIEAAGGAATDDKGVDILDKQVTELHQRTSIIIGSNDEVAQAVKVLNP